jgi:hypothetical protein
VPFILWCRECRYGYGSVGELPEACPECHAPHPWTDQLWTVPKVKWEIGLNDRRFLRSLRIAVEEPDVARDEDDDGA